MFEKMAILIGIVVLSFSVQALSGFGSMVISITLGSHLFPITMLLPILVPLDVLLNGYIALRYRSYADRPFFLKKIIPFVGIGLLAGMIFFIFFAGLQAKYLKILFGAFVVAISSWELFIVLRRGEQRAISPLSSAAYMILGGFVQGIFAGGGPPVVYAASRSIRDRIAFRSTLSMLWLTTNSILTAYYIVSGKLTTETLWYSAVLLPAVAAGLFIGDRLHHRINEHHFRLVVFCLLIIAGLSILILSPVNR